MRKGLLFGVPSFSSCKTIDPIATELRRSGYEIISYNAPEFAPPADRRVPFKPYPVCYDVATIDRQMSSFVLVEMLLDTALGLRDFLRREIETERPDVILHPHLSVWGKASAARYRLPAVALHCTFVLDRRILLPFFKRRGEEGHRVRGDMRQFIRCQQKYRKLYADVPGGGPAPDVWDAYVNKEPLNLVFIQRDLQEQAEMLGPEYRFVGHPTNAAPRVGERRVIYLSLGTILTDDVELLRLGVRVFGRLENPCLISLGHKLTPAALAPIPEHVAVAPFVDQEQVLADAAIFITMGGMGSVQEAIAAEVPMIVIPATPEQHMSARRLTTLGIAIDLDRRQLTEERLLAAITHLLRDGQRYRDRIRALKARHAYGDAATLARAHIDAYLSDRMTVPA